jgi:hypothetical protein
MPKSLLQINRGVLKITKRLLRTSGFVCPPHLRLFLVRVLGRRRGR